MKLSALLFGLLFLPNFVCKGRSQTPADPVATSAASRKKSNKPYVPSAAERALLDAATAQPAVNTGAASAPALTITSSPDDPNSPKMPAAVPFPATPSPPARAARTPAAPAIAASRPAPAPAVREPRVAAVTAAVPTHPRPTPLPHLELTRSTTLMIALDDRATELTLTDLQHLPQHLVSVPDANGNPILYNGPLVADILNRAGLPSTADPQSPILQSFIRATATDGHSVLYSAAELEPQLSSGLVIVALRRDGAFMPYGLQLVDPIDTTPVRSIQGLSSLSVITLTP